MATDENHPADPDRVAETSEWPRGYEGHERAQRRRMAKWSLAEKLKWLEIAQARVRALRGPAVARAEPPSGNRNDP